MNATEQQGSLGIIYLCPDPHTGRCIMCDQAFSTPAEGLRVDFYSPQSEGYEYYDVCDGCLGKDEEEQQP